MSGSEFAMSRNQGAPQASPSAHGPDSGESSGGGHWAAQPRVESGSSAAELTDRISACTLALMQRSTYVQWVAALVFSRFAVSRKRIEHCQKLSVCLKTEQSLSKLIDGQRWDARVTRRPTH